LDSDQGRTRNLEDLVDPEDHHDLVVLADLVDPEDHHGLVVLADLELEVHHDLEDLEELLLVRRVLLLLLEVLDSSCF